MSFLLAYLEDKASTLLFEKDKVTMSASIGLDSEYDPLSTYRNTISERINQLEVSVASNTKDYKQLAKKAFRQKEDSPAVSIARDGLVELAKIKDCTHKFKISMESVIRNYTEKFKNKAETEDPSKEIKKISENYDKLIKYFEKRLRRVDDIHDWSMEQKKSDISYIMGKRLFKYVTYYLERARVLGETSEVLLTTLVREIFYLRKTTDSFRINSSKDFSQMALNSHLEDSYFDEEDVQGFPEPCTYFEKSAKTSTPEKKSPETSNQNLGSSVSFLADVSAIQRADTDDDNETLQEKKVLSSARRLFRDDDQTDDVSLTNDTDNTTEDAGLRSISDKLTPAEKKTLGKLMTTISRYQTRCTLTATDKKKKDRTERYAKNKLNESVNRLSVFKK